MCPYCNSPHSIVIHTENFGKFIRRRRRCKGCGGEFYGNEEFGGIIKEPPQANGDEGSGKIRKNDPG